MDPNRIQYRINNQQHRPTELNYPELTDVDVRVRPRTSNGDIGGLPPDTWTSELVGLVAGVARALSFGSLPTGSRYCVKSAQFISPIRSLFTMFTQLFDGIRS